MAERKYVDREAVDFWSLLHFLVAFLLCCFISYFWVFIAIVIYEVAEYLFIGEAFFRWRLSGRYETSINILSDFVFGMIGIFIHFIFFGGLA